MNDAQRNLLAKSLADIAKGAFIAPYRSWRRQDDPMG